MNEDRILVKLLDDLETVAFDIGFSNKLLKDNSSFTAPGAPSANEVKKRREYLIKVREKIRKSIMTYFNEK